MKTGLTIKPVTSQPISNLMTVKMAFTANGINTLSTCDGTDHI